MRPRPGGDTVVPMTQLAAALRRRAISNQVLIDALLAGSPDDPLAHCGVPAWPEPGGEPSTDRPSRPRAALPPDHAACLPATVPNRRAGDHRLLDHGLQPSRLSGGRRPHRGPAGPLLRRREHRPAHGTYGRGCDHIRDRSLPGRYRDVGEPEAGGDPRHGRRQLRDLRDGVDPRRQRPGPSGVHGVARGTRGDARARTRETRASRSPRSERGSPASCTTSSRTTSA